MKINDVRVGQRVKIIKKPYCSYSRERESVYSDTGEIDIMPDSDGQVIFKNDRNNIFELINVDCLEPIE